MTDEESRGQWIVLLQRFSSLAATRVKKSKGANATRPFKNEIITEKCHQRAVSPPPTSIIIVTAAITATTAAVIASMVSEPAASAASATSTPVESHAEPRRRTKSSYSYAPDHNDSSKLDPVFFRSFDLSNDDDVVYSPAKPERYIKLDYNWSLTPRKKGDRFADEYPDEPIGRSGDDRPPASGSAKQQHRSDGEDDDDSDDDEIIPRPQSSSSDTSTSSRHSRPQSVSPRSSGAKSGDARRQELIGQLQTRSKLRKPGSWREDPVRAPSTKSSVDDDQNEDEDDEDSSDSEPQEF